MWYLHADGRFLQADWEDTNRKSTMFAALQQDEETEEHDIDDSMATDKTEQPKSSLNAYASAAVSQQVGEDPAMDDEDDEIT